MVESASLKAVCDQPGGMDSKDRLTPKAHFVENRTI